MGNIGSHVDLTSGQGRHQVNQPEHPKLGNKNRQLPHPGSEVELAARDLVVARGFPNRNSAAIRRKAAYFRDPGVALPCGWIHRFPLHIEPTILKR